MKLTKYYGFQLSEKIQNLELTSEVILETYLEKIKIELQKGGKDGKKEKEKER